MKTLQALSIVLLLFCVSVAAQNKFPNAIERSGDAGRIIATLALVPESGLPSGLFERAVAVGVFPRVKKETLLFTTVTQGYGVLSSRVDGGWTMPAFYQFSGGGYGNPFAQTETFGIIFFFMSKEAVAAFEKGGVPLKGENKAIAGPVEPLTDEQRKQLDSAEILAYAYFNGKLKGTAFGTSLWKNFSSIRTIRSTPHFMA